MVRGSGCGICCVMTLKVADSEKGFTIGADAEDQQRQIHID